jgi:hypothetical protein
MKVRRWLLDRSRAVHSFLAKTFGVNAQKRLNIPRGDSK